MHSQQANDALNVLEMLLTEIRGMAGQAIGAGYQASSQLRPDPKDACRAIFTLADAAHNLPAVIVLVAPTTLPAAPVLRPTVIENNGRVAL